MLGSSDALARQPEVAGSRVEAWGVPGVPLATSKLSLFDIGRGSSTTVATILQCLPTKNCNVYLRNSILLLSNGAAEPVMFSPIVYCHVDFCFTSKMI